MVISRFCFFCIVICVSGTQLAWAEVQKRTLTQCDNLGNIQPTEDNYSLELSSEYSLPEIKNAKITSITLHQLNVFDTSLPEENNALFRFANRAHITTKPEVIKSVLLFTEQSTYDPLLLIESERLLRQQSYLYDARIFATENCDGGIAVTVVTRDLWTLLPDLSFSRSGGENASRVGFRESNLFGYGKRLSLTHIEDADRSGYLFVYDDPNILSSRYKGRIEYSDNDDGERHHIGVDYPFFSTRTPHSYGFFNYANKRIEPLYENGETVSEFEQDSKTSHIYYGIAKTLEANWTRRIIVGYRDQQESFRKISSSTLPVADQRKLSYPFIQAQWLETNFIKVRNFDSIYRTEDLNMGWNINTQLGYSSDTISKDDTRWVFNTTISKAHYASEQGIFRFNFILDGYWNVEKNETENLITQLNLEYHFNTGNYQSWYTQFNITHGKHLTEDKQLTLGGETGLRGFPARYLQGDRRVVLNIEKRYYWEYDLFQLFKVGGAAYFDIGRVDGKTLFTQNHKFYKNMGFGIRMAPSRANSGLVLHLDLAAPIDKPASVDSVQWHFTVKNRF
ncbi:ShlB/FhaC/HecB family hemolysin secretion/activation protein [Pseudoalteromonas luteoviolacea]|uniref:ShlB/FhaC/HecB family hemolysin secretion/activation protein n=1 Tax=Pseudoalteromonas luteoviolacea TaxID=43657 RepID=UPI00069B5BA7|nr:hypothetical protein S4054249_04275 [Pseudoalteromonas luteoviolacea]AOT15071.1 hypothetical protein S40542_04275 [Pseudoalteromonas luteoviolacea]AOT19987.1 hypothetical protein S4054_04275 [Pseudoalteromonas luteoviolacea]